MSIDDATPEAWDRINKWHRNGPDQHPLFPTKDDPEMLSDLLKEDYKLAEEKMKDSYTRQGYKFKTSWGDEDAISEVTPSSIDGDVGVRATLLKTYARHSGMKTDYYLSYNQTQLNSNDRQLG